MLSAYFAAGVESRGICDCFAVGAEEAAGAPASSATTGSNGGMFAVDGAGVVIVPLSTPSRRKIKPRHPLG